METIHREKINQSILTLWVTQVSVGIQSITLDLHCNCALLNVDIQTLLLSTYCLKIEWKQTLVFCIALFFSVIIDLWTKSFGFGTDVMVARKDVTVLKRSCIKRMLIEGVHNQNTVSFLFLSAMYLSVIQPN